MTIKYVVYCTSEKPACAFIPDAPVVICLADSALVVQPTVPCEIELTTIVATICAASSLQHGCQSWTYNYTFAYDDEQIVNTDRGLLQADITGFFCEDCYTTYVAEQIGCVQSSKLQQLYSQCSGRTSGPDEAVIASFDVPVDTLIVHSQRLDIYAAGDSSACIEADTGSVTFSFSLVAVIDGVDHVLVTWLAAYPSLDAGGTACAEPEWVVRGRIGVFCEVDSELSLLQLSGDGYFSGNPVYVGTVSVPGTFTDITIEVRSSYILNSGDPLDWATETNLTAFTVDFVDEAVTSTTGCCE